MEGIMKIFDTHGRVKAVINSTKPSKEDPMGSYTGKPIEKNEKPVVDADDL
jgi:hypothetical protein